VQRLLDNVDVYVYREVRTDRYFTQAGFAWIPPKGAVDRRKLNGQRPKLLQVGEIAPEFELPLTNGKRVSLGGALKGKKGLLVNFWFINCGCCQLEMPEFAGLYRKAKDLEIPAINDTDTADEIRRFVKKSDYHFPVAIDEGGKAAQAYRVKEHGHPLTYLILPDRTVA
jgi:peroxiredoxin